MVASANANKDIVRGIKGHAEIGGFARWGTVGEKIDTFLTSSNSGQRFCFILLIQVGLFPVSGN